MRFFAIQYESRSTVNGEPVGTVYAVDISHLSPGAWSYTKDPERATLFKGSELAERVIAQHLWHAATVVEVSPR